MSGVDGFDVAVRVARLTLESSAEGVEVLEQYVALAAAAYDVEVTLVVLPEQLVVSDSTRSVAQRVTLVRAAPGIFRLDQLTALKGVLVDIERGISAEEACTRLDQIEESRPLWPWWARVLGVGLFAAGFAPSIVSSWSEAGAAVGLGLLMGLLVVGTAGRTLEPLVPFIGAFVVTVLALTVMEPLAASTGVTLLVIPALFIVVPGDTLSAAAGELLDGHLTTGAIRLVSSFFVLGLIVVGIVAAADVTGNGEALTETLPEPELSQLVMAGGWVVFSIGLVLVFNGPFDLLWWLAPSVIATYALQQGVTALAGSVIGTLVAGAALGAFAALVSDPPNRPPRLALVLGGFFVLTVGGVGVRGLTSLVGGDVVSGVDNLVAFGVQMPTVALALAFGVVLTSALRRTERAIR